MDPAPVGTQPTPTTTTGGTNMPGPRPGSNAYDKQRARLRKLVDNSGQAADQDANDTANQILQDEQDRPGIARGERTYGPKAEREPGDPR